MKNIFKKEAPKKGKALTWAEREVEIACKYERADSGAESGWDYGCACYESALKAYKSLAEDGHSGFSIQMTKHILVRLIEGKPLTPIEDTDDVWSDVTCIKEDRVTYQNKRMSSLFKHVYNDGTVKYRDVDSQYAVQVDDESNSFHSGLVQQIMDEMFPITMPYYPGKPVKFVCDDCLTDRKNGDFDTRAVLYAVKDDERILIGRYFKETEDGWEEIDEKEHWERVMRASQRIYDENQEAEANE